MIEVSRGGDLPLDPARLRTVLGATRYEPGGEGRQLSVWVGGTRIGYINSSASGGGVADMRGMPAVPLGTDAAGYERAGYVRALRAANACVHGPW
jgi:hypothetical protein